MAPAWHRGHKSIAEGPGEKAGETTKENGLKLSRRFDRAFSMAIELHGEQKRKGSGVPYMGHLLAVTAIVIDDGGTENEAIAALLHDGPEDRGGEETLERIRVEFGDEVAEIVEALSDTFEAVKPPWEERKQAYLDKLRNKPDTDLTRNILRVSLADKLHNARAVKLDWEREGEKVWSHFNASKEQTLWYYRTLGEIYREKLGDTPLVKTYLQAELELRDLK